MKSLSINPMQMEKDASELAKYEQDVAELNQFMGMTGQGNAGNNASAEATGEAGLPAEINQAGNPLSGVL